MGEREQKEGKFFFFSLSQRVEWMKRFWAGWKWKHWQWRDVKEEILKKNNVALCVNARVWAWTSELMKWLKMEEKKHTYFFFYFMRVSKEIVVYVNLSVII